MSKLETSKGVIVFAGNSHPALANLVANHMNITLGQSFVFNKTNRETSVEINETVRGKDVFILQTGTKNVNNDVMELLVMVYACHSSSARNITVVMPYLPYCKQSKMRKRGCIVGRLLASMLIKAGMTRMITMDLHAKEIQGFYDRPVENLRASPFLIQYIVDNVQDYRNAVIVARNPSAVNRATSFAERLRLSIAVIHGVEKAESEQDDGRASPPPQGGAKAAGSALLEKRPKPRDESVPATRQAAAASSARVRQLSTSSLQAFHAGLELMPMNKAKDKPPMNVVGDVSGRIAIIVDDMIDDVDQFVTAAELLQERGAYKVMVMATHGILSSDAPRKIDDSRIDEVVVTNTVPHEIQKMQCHKIKTVDVSVLIAEAIRRITHNESMSYLFTNISVHD